MTHSSLISDSIVSWIMFFPECVISQTSRKPNQHTKLPNTWYTLLYPFKAKNFISKVIRKLWIYFDIFGIEKALQVLPTILLSHAGLLWSYAVTWMNIFLPDDIFQLFRDKIAVLFHPLLKVKGSTPTLKKTCRLTIYTMVLLDTFIQSTGNICTKESDFRYYVALALGSSHTCNFETQYYDKKIIR